MFEWFKQNKQDIQDALDIQDVQDTINKYFDNFIGFAYEYYIPEKSYIGVNFYVVVKNKHQYDFIKYKRYVAYRHNMTTIERFIYQLKAKPAGYYLNINKGMWYDQQGIQDISEDIHDVKEEIRDFQDIVNKYSYCFVDLSYDSYIHGKMIIYVVVNNRQQYGFIEYKRYNLVDSLQFPKMIESYRLSQIDTWLFENEKKRKKQKEYMLNKNNSLIQKRD